MDGFCYVDMLMHGDLLPCLSTGTIVCEPGLDFPRAFLAWGRGWWALRFIRLAPVGFANPVAGSSDPFIYGLLSFQSYPLLPSSKRTGIPWRRVNGRPAPFAPLKRSSRVDHDTFPTACLSAGKAGMSQPVKHKGKDNDH